MDYLNFLQAIVHHAFDVLMRYAGDCSGSGVVVTSRWCSTRKIFRSHQTWYSSARKVGRAPPYWWLSAIFLCWSLNSRTNHQRHINTCSKRTMKSTWFRIGRNNIWNIRWQKYRRTILPIRKMNREYKWCIESYTVYWTSRSHGDFYNMQPMPSLDVTCWVMWRRRKCWWNELTLPCSNKMYPRWEGWIG